MAGNNIINLLGHPFTPETYKTPKEQFKDHLVNCGYNPPSEIIGDGNPHKFPLNNEDKTKAAWYVFFDDSYPAGVVSDWKSKIKHEFKAFIGRELTPAEEMAQKRKIHEAQKKREEALEIKHNQASNNSSYIWENSGPAEITHNYLKMKELQFTHGARVSGDGRLIIPLKDKNKKITSLQYISNEGGKQFQPGGEVVGMSWSLGEIKDHVYIVEGFATGATIREETDSPVVIAYNAGNLPPVAKRIRAEYPGIIITIIADNDSLKSNTGEKKAREAAEQSGCLVIMPPDPGDINDYRLGGKDVKSLLLNTEKEEWLVKGSGLLNQPKPIKWLIKGWLQKHSTMMLHGQSGCGKTFVVLDMILHVAFGIELWFGKKVHNGSVVYLAGEGYRGIAARLKGWIQEKAKSGELDKNDIEDLIDNFAISKSGTDLDTEEGLSKVIRNIEEIGMKPSIIVVDTLHRFLLEDEDKDQSVKGMDRSCHVLKEKYGCSVLLVHHTGHSSGAQDRGKGSASWRGILEVEMSLKPQGKLEDPEIVLSMPKIKDGEHARPINMIRKKIDVEGWLDEDDEQVTTVILEENTDISSTNKLKEKKESAPLSRAKGNIKEAWQKYSGELSISGDPYISTKDLLKYFIDDLGKTVPQATQASKKSASGIMGTLYKKGVVEPFNKGFIVRDQELVSQMTMVR